MNKLSIFDPKQHKFTDWLEVFQQFIILKDLQAEEAKKRALLITHLSPDDYHLLKNLALPDLVTAKTAAELSRLLLDYYDKPQSSTLARHQFQAIKQAPQETIQAYAQRLQGAARDCQFGAQFTERVRDQFLSSLTNTEITFRILEDPALVNFDAILQRALALERTIGDVASMRSQDAGVPSVHQVTASFNKAHRGQRDCGQGSQAAATTCHRCGRNHYNVECKFINSECHYCHKIGHLKSVCKSFIRDQAQKYFPAEKRRFEHKNLPQNSQSDRPIGKSAYVRGGSGHNVHMVHDQTTNQDHRSEDPSSCPDCQPNNSSIWTIWDGSLPLMTNVHMRRAGNTNNDWVEVTMQIDSGAMHSVMSLSTFMQLGFTQDMLSVSKISLKSYTGEVIPTVGQLSVCVSFNGKQYVLPIIIVSTNSPTLFGLPWLKAFGVETVLSKIDSISSVTLFQNEFVDEYRDVFDCITNQQHCDYIFESPIEFTINSDLSLTPAVSGLPPSPRCLWRGAAVEGVSPRWGVQVRGYYQLLMFHLLT